MKEYKISAESINLYDFEMLNSLGDLWYLEHISDAEIKAKLNSVVREKVTDLSESMQVFRAVKDYLLEHGNKEQGC